MAVVYEETNSQYAVTNQVEPEFKNWTVLQCISPNIHFGLLLKGTNWSILD